MPHQTFRGPAAKIDFGDEFRSYPHDAFSIEVRQVFLEQGSISAQRLQLRPEGACSRGGETSADAAGIRKLVIVIVAEHESSHRAGAVGAIKVTRDHELLTLGAFN